MSDPLKAWSRDFVEHCEERDHFETIDNLYVSYVNEMESNRLKATAKNKFGLRLKKLYRFKKFMRRVVTGRKVACIYGIKLATQQEM
jgi:hypothetical protein